MHLKFRLYKQRAEVFPALVTSGQDMEQQIQEMMMIFELLLGLQQSPQKLLKEIEYLSPHIPEQRVGTDPQLLGVRPQISSAAFRLPVLFSQIPEKEKIS